MLEHFRVAIHNIATHGDTDVLPFTLENHIFFDKEQETLDLLMKIHADFDGFLDDNAVISESSLVPIGYTGFRWVTQIDPIWNAYLLGLVVSAADKIERRRIPLGNNTVFSYRFNYNEATGTLFDTSIGWREFQQASVGRAEGDEFKSVLICDIADFYQRISHSRLASALQTAKVEPLVVERIIRLLEAISKWTPHGLPVGGPAARLLSELLLDRIDRLLQTRGITFCRYADDYHLFAPTEEAAYANLLFLSQKLLENEGLSLQKSKTRIMSAEEFISLSEFGVAAELKEPGESQSRSILSLRIDFDPYSPTATQDYEERKRELSKYNIEELLAREMGKSRVHMALTKKLISFVRYMEPTAQTNTVRALIDNLSPRADGISLLYPVFANVMILIKAIIHELNDDLRLHCFQTLRELIKSRSYVIKLPVNLCYALRALSDDPSTEMERLLAELYLDTSSMMLKRDIILMMANRNAEHWVADIKNNFDQLHGWERRSLIIASFVLGDEGGRWRAQVRKQISDMDWLYLNWAAEKHGLRSSPAAASPRRSKRGGRAAAKTPEGYGTPAAAQIFLNYASEDLKRVTQLYDKLLEAGFNPWMDKKNLVAGQPWQKIIKKAIRDSDFVLICFSSTSVRKRGYVQSEIKDVLNIRREKLESDIYSIPVRLDDCEIPESLQDLQWVDLFSSEGDGLEQIIKALRHGMAGLAPEEKAEQPSAEFKGWRIPL